MFKDALGKKQKYFSIAVSRPEKGYGAEGDKTSEMRCPSCAGLVLGSQLWERFKVCPDCGYHHPVGGIERLAMVIDPGSFEEMDADLVSDNPLGFPGYDEKLVRAGKESGLKEAVVTGKGRIKGQPAVLALMDSRFMMGSMGRVVGEKIVSAMAAAVVEKIPFIAFTASGGARMQEGMLSLVQMARTSAEAGRLDQEGILFISVLTHPTTGGVLASFASLADVIIAEPGALIGFTGPRVIAQTTGSQLPEGFQRSEFLLEHGMVDMVCPRDELKSTLAWLIRVHRGENDG